MNIIRTVFACVKFALFWVAVIASVPGFIILPRGRISIWYAGKIFWPALMGITGVRAKVNGELASGRPLLLVSNHISVFEFATFPMAGLGSFFGKAEIEKYPLVGWVAKKIGVIFIDRNPRKAAAVTQQIQNVMSQVKYPMTIFPEGTTSNGNFIYPFKSSMFDILNALPDMTVQPVAMVYKYRNGKQIPPRIMANDFSLPNLKLLKKYNEDFEKEEIIPAKDHSPFGLVFNVMKQGGILVEINLLPPPSFAKASDGTPLGGMDRKQIAGHLHKIISDKFYELRNKNEY
ncbi:MAG: 1-acyl-sn-glycerol-3-phosphate acyltransferase [Rickettsiales bacterium]|jgi:1-acyl-sn-glycerol-3-phosphate acyltransferase|nr:1-acyl-sn-glycerol-3-phosphate acyltransferase [Rickettsiales bacterium]